MKGAIGKKSLVRISDYVWELPQRFREHMRVPARLLVSEALLDQILQDSSLWQLTNVATLPGIQTCAWAMSDIHEGYGFPIGGVAAMAVDEGGVISPGGIGYDINCGVRLLALNLSHADVKDRLRTLAYGTFNAVPSGVGQGGRHRLGRKEMDHVLEKGAAFALKMGFGEPEDLSHCEESGGFDDADPDQVSLRARERGENQLGTLGSGNHFLEYQVVDEIFDAEAASVFGLREGDVTVMIHCGSRGLGHQVCTDYVANFLEKLSKWGLHLADRQLACAPIESEEGQNYLGAMKAAANFAWANRHVIAHHVRELVKEEFGQDTAVRCVYDVAHNIGKVEQHQIDHQKKRLLVHRKGATRAFGPGHIEVPEHYRSIGQPVLIPGTMGTASYVLKGTQQGFETTFGSCCHGAGRAMSRVKAKKTVKGLELRRELESRDILVCSDSDRGLAEEAPLAYKDIDEVVRVVHEAHIARRVARLRPIAVIKGG